MLTKTVIHIFLPEILSVIKQFSHFIIDTYIGGYWEKLLHETIPIIQLVEILHLNKNRQV